MQHRSDIAESPRAANFCRWRSGVVTWGEYMASLPEQFPGGSKSRVTKAGEAVRTGTPTFEDLAIIDEWRAAHRNVLNTFQALLRNRTRGTKIVVAQRHKRRTTIFGKLRRFPSMQLARMDDVAGCRLIFPDINALYEFRNEVHKSRSRHKLKNEKDKYDYLKAPKVTGYRGIHDVYEYDVNSVHGRRYKGLLIELQYRTFYQHAWATAVEVVGFITQSQPKFQEGDQRYEVALSYASEIISRAHEGMKSCHPDLEDTDVVEKFLDYDRELGLMPMLRALNSADADVTANKNVILIFGDPIEGKPDLETRSYRDATEALRALFDLEKEHPGKDIVLVRAETSDEVRVAFRNYFADAQEFIRLVESGCEKLVGRKVMVLAKPQRRSGRKRAAL
jgi:putative GTP pyrophosphokinase